MRYGIISDIHGNLEALEAVFKELEKQDLDKILCLGDVIGYGPDPEECVALVRSRADIILAGNHDYAPLGLVDTSFFNIYAKTAVEWTASRLSDETRTFLEQCPLRAEFENFTIVHATPSRPEAWNYILSIDDAVENFPHFKGQVCFIGHSHVPLIIEEKSDGRILVHRKNMVRCDSESRYIINVGSVGQPRDLNPRAACALFDSERLEYELLRVEYEVGMTQRKILDRGLPAFLAERLALGQ